MKKKSLFAFTLIELLVVIAIVGVLSGFIFVTMSNAVASAKDGKRKADLANIEKGLLAYYAQNNAYPSNDTSYPCTIGAGGTCNNLSTNLSPYLATLPIGPDGDRYTYNYSSGNFTLSGTLSTGPWAYNSQVGVWGSGYSLGQYKIQITVPTAAGASANYPIQLVINSSSIGATPLSHIASDFRDLRFTDSSGTTQIPYWIESYTASTTATVWVQVPSISSGTTIYMYYGTQATTASSGTNTFPSLFDDFTSGTVPNSALWNDAVSTVSNSICSTYNNWGALTTKSTFSPPYAIRAKLKNYNTSSSKEFFNISGNEQMTCRLYDTAYGAVYQLASYSGSWTSFGGIPGWSAGAFHILDVTRSSTGNNFTVKCDGGSAVSGSYSYGTVAQSFSFEVPYNGKIDVDWIFVRPWVSTEPASGSLTYGSETTGQ